MIMSCWVYNPPGIKLDCDNRNIQKDGKWWDSVLRVFVVQEVVRFYFRIVSNQQRVYVLTPSACITMIMKSSK